MCTLIFWYRAFEDFPLLVAANRDERLDRPSAPPSVRQLSRRRVLCPTDVLAGGTWLGVNDRRLFAAITNRSWNPKQADRRSRGELVLEALDQDDAESAVRTIAALDPRRENAFHLALADEKTAHLVQCDGTSMTHRALEPGLHILTERSFGPEPPAREASIRGRLGTLSEPPSDAFLIDVLASHSVRLENYGTRSSTILHIAKQTRFQFADGPLPETPFREFGDRLVIIGGQAGAVLVDSARQ
jgi:uncharacterized protein with NRDE domain